MDLSKLNPPQRHAVTTTEGPLLVLAGAGSGKTRVLTHRIAYLLEKGVPAYSILALTFTNKAAREMLERVNTLAGASAQDAWVSTFHSICARILRRDIEKLGYTRSFTIYDSDDQERLVRDILKTFDLDPKQNPPRNILSAISDAKNKMLSPVDWLNKNGDDYKNHRIFEIYTEYDKQLKKANALDFDDLLIKTLELFVQHPPVLDSYRRRFRYILVDEYQDTNAVQYEIIRLLAAEHHNLCVVGDDDQSIYGWRGADIHNILNFERDFPEVVTVKLEQNYRSTGNILDAANQVIAHNTGRKEKSLWTEQTAGEPVRLYEARDERDEAYRMARIIGDLLRQGEKPGSIAVLYRVNALSRVLEETLVRAGIRYRVFGGLKFYERKEVKDLLCYLRAVVNPGDDQAIKRIINEPKRAIGNTTIEKLEEFARESDGSLFAAILDCEMADLTSRAIKSVQAFGDLITELIALKETMPPDAFVRELLAKTAYAEQYKQETNDENISRLQNIDEFVGGVADFIARNPESTLEDYLENVALVTEMDNAEDDEGAVTLMTVHSAKGLEFPTVFVVGLEQNIFPGMRAINSETGVEEERRLCYVAITRAQKRLYLFHAHERTLYGYANAYEQSMFLDELPSRVCEDMNASEFGGETLSRPRTGSRMPSYEDSRAGYGARRPSPYASRNTASAYNPRAAAPQKRTSSLPRTGGYSPASIPGVTKGYVLAQPTGYVTSQAAQIQPPASSFYSIGDRVKHVKFGTGTVVGTGGAGRDAVVTVEFDSGETKKLSASAAPMVRIG